MKVQSKQHRRRTPHQLAAARKVDPTPQEDLAGAALARYVFQPARAEHGARGPTYRKNMGDVLASEAAFRRDVPTRAELDWRAITRGEGMAAARASAALGRAGLLLRLEVARKDRGPEARKEERAAVAGLALLGAVVRRARRVLATQAESEGR